MRFGCCVNMLAQGADRTGIEHLEQLKEIGYDYIELPLAQMMELSDEMFQKLCDRVLQSGIHCEVCNNFLPRHIQLTGNQVNRQAVSNYLDVALHRAVMLGVKKIVFGSAESRNVPDGFSKPTAYQQVIDFLSDLNERVCEQKITIVIEPLNKRESNLINTVQEGLELAKAVRKSHVKLLVDYYHLTAENESPEILLTAADWIDHVHFAKSQSRVFPKLGDGDHYEPFFICLKQINYDMRVSVEAYSNQVQKDAPSALNLLKSFG